jgi:capsular exopolysaccharide synthesis family protein
MSRLFDALQRSGVERSGIAYDDMMTMVAEVFEEPRHETQVAVEEAASAVPDATMVEMSRPNVSTQESEEDVDPPQFHSVEAWPVASKRLVYFSEPDGMAAEKFRFLSVRLRQMQQSRSLKTVLITSTIPEEGKSTVGANLACTLARRGQKRTLLLDGDLRRPSIADVFGLGDVAGISEWLQGEAGPTTCIHQLKGMRLCILPAGAPPKHPLELMQSGKLLSIMQRLSTWFDWIVIDSPPVLPLADTSIWLRMADGALLVARQGVTRRTLLKRGMEGLESSKLLGTILNGATKRVPSDYYYQASPPRKADSDPVS